jgi:hypothetical protein
MNEVENLYGEQGDDIIFGGTAVMTTQNIHGGSGDDKVYAGAENAGVTKLFGNSGKDIVRSDYWRTYGIGTESNDGGNEFLYGDFKYGEDALDKDLWGDDDLIYGGYGAGTAEQKIYAGDGADYISTGHNWTVTYVEGGNGDDTYKAPQMISTSNTFRGGDGDDTVLVEAYGLVTTGEENV